MGEIREPKEECTAYGKKVCVNIDEIQNDLEKLFPHYKIKNFADAAGVSPQTWLRWKKSNRADIQKVEVLIKECKRQLKNLSTLDIPLSQATPDQLYVRCEQLGWGRVIGSMRKD